MADITPIRDRGTRNGTRRSGATDAGRAMNALLGACLDFGLLGVATGPSGAGKTTAAREFAAGRPEAVYCRLDSGAARPRGAMVQLWEAVGAPAANLGRTHDAYLAVAEGLRLEGAPRLLVLDEAQHMGAASLEHVRDLYDACGTGIALVGTPELAGLLSRHAGRGLAQLVGRVGPRLELPAPTGADLRTIAADGGVADPASWATVERASRLPGALHNVASLLRVARLVEAGDGPLAPASVARAAALTGVDP